MSRCILKLKNVSFSYSEKPTLENIDFSLTEGDHLTVIGASGCGKTTLLEVIYGLHKLDSGQVFWQGQELKGPGERLIPGEPFFKYVSQNFDLFPFHTVAENVGMHLKGIPDNEKDQRIMELLTMVELEGFAEAKGKDLSGGQKQRVALIRALADEPELLLLDEPFSHIDQFRKNHLRRNLFAYFKKKGMACIVATHDSMEVLAFSDKTVVMDEGKILSCETPRELYQNPRNEYIASLFGEVNVISLQALLADERRTNNVLLYPHELKFSEDSHFEVRVIRSFFKGNSYLVQADYIGQKVFFESNKDIQPNTIVGLKAEENLVRSRM